MLFLNNISPLLTSEGVLLLLGRLHHAALSQSSQVSINPSCPAKPQAEGG